jgi:predicted ATP-binding protein involved in virulence
LQIHRLTVRNFRCFEEAEWEFAPRFNLIAGDNGSGKTAILDAITAAVRVVADRSYFDLKRIDQHNPEVRRSWAQLGETRVAKANYPVSVSLTAQLLGSACEWEIVHDYFSSAHANLRGDTPLLSAEDGTPALLDERVHDELTPLPLVLHLSCDRLSGLGGLTEISDSGGRPAGRTAGYQSWRDPRVSLEGMLDWFRDMEGRALQTKSPLPTLAGVKQAVLRCVPRAVSLRYDFTEKDLVLELQDGRALPLSLTSHGYRTVIAMVANIAYRCAVLNPQFMAQAPDLTEGVVLIDELDLHLHPKWQRQVVESLCAAFPKLQFIATSHSPFIIQSLDPDRGDRLINLDDPTAVDVENKSIEEIAEENQGVPDVQRSHRFTEMIRAAEEYYRVLQQVPGASSAQVAHLKARLDELTLPYSDDPAYVAFMKTERAASGIDGKNGNAPA